MADLTSQPSLNAFCAAMEGLERAPGIDYMRLEPYDVYWAKVRAMYAPFCVEINHWFGGPPPNFRTLYLNQIEVDSADF